LIHKLFAVVQVYELGDSILMETFGLQELYDFCSYCMSHRLQPDKFGEMVWHTKITELPTLVLGYGPIKSMNNLWPARSVTRCSPMGGRLFLLAVLLILQTSHSSLLFGHLQLSLANSISVSTWQAICATPHALQLWRAVLSRLNRVVVIRSGCVMAIFPPLYTVVCQWIVAGRAIRSPIVKVVRRKLCHCS